VTTLEDSQKTIAISAAQPQDRMPPVPASVKTTDEKLRYVGPLVVFGLVMGAWYSAHWWIITYQPYRKFLLPNPHEIIRDGFFGEKIVRTKIIDATILDIKIAVAGLLIAEEVARTFVLAVPCRAASHSDFDDFSPDRQFHGICRTAAGFGDSDHHHLPHYL
jgi:hypothetical protein